MKGLSSLCAVSLVAFLSVVFLFSSHARAAEVALAADSHINVARPTTNFGNVSNLYVGNGYTALLQFDLTTLPPGLSSPQISRAILTVYVNRVNAAGTVALVPVLGTWTEGGITYSTAPAFGPSSSSFVVSTAGSYVTIDITTLVQGWVTTPSSNFGVALSALTANVLLDSKENDETGHAAKLDISLTSTGTQGIQGIKGVAGSIGATGPIGVAGAAGAAGAQGTQGLIGPIGAMGPIGLAGPTGLQGPTGAVGAMGPQGLQGLVGPTGEQGIAGAAGTTGTQGIQGIAGPSGANGTNGTNGINGTNGADGAIGLTGLAGANGANGANGADGAVGAPGAAGNLGTVLNYSSSTSYVSGQVVYCATGCATNGSTYIALNPATGDDPSTDPGNFQPIALAGTNGANGTIGPIGAMGPIGPAGPTGLQGTTGAVGAMGPQGLQGLVGPTGEQGIAGAAGATGTQGIQGIAGPSGANGTNGTNGINGVNGINGADGAIGLTGLAGANGANGADGAVGAPGAAGNLGTVLNYSSSTSYVSGQVVYCATGCATNGSTYIALNPATGDDPSTDPVNFQPIALAVANGADGTPGATGPQGPAGANGSNGGGGVTSIAAGNITTGGNTGSVTVNNGTGAATVDVNFPFSSIYGDGSDGTTSGVCSITSDTDWHAANSTQDDPQCTSFTVSAGVTLVVPSGTIIRSTGNVEIDGTIVVATGGAQGLFLQAADNYSSTVPFYNGGVPLATSALRRMMDPGVFGGGNAGREMNTQNNSISSGNGGGSLKILGHGALTVSSGGTVQAVGQAGLSETAVYLNDGGGGGGILILASATSVTNNGTLDVHGGSGANYNPLYGGMGGGGGGGGIIHLFAPAGQINAGIANLAGGTTGTTYQGMPQYGGGGGATGGAGGSFGVVAGPGAIFTTYVADPATLFFH